MSTAYSPAEPPAEPAGTVEPTEPTSTAEPAEAAAAPAKRPLIQRVPTPFFVVGYGALLVALVVLLAMLAAYANGAGSSRGRTTALTSESNAPTGAEASGEASQSNGPEKRYPFNPAPADPEEVRDSVRSYYITDLETVGTHTGTAASGKMTEAAEENPVDFAGHLSRLLQQSCLDELELTTRENMRVLFQGFCFSTLPPSTIVTAIRTANNLDADAVYLNSYHPGLGNEMAFKWLKVADDDELQQLRDKWDDIDFPDGVRHLQFNASTPDTAYSMHHEQGRDPVLLQGETGDALAEKYGIKS